MENNPNIEKIDAMIMRIIKRNKKIQQEKLSKAKLEMDKAENLLVESLDDTQLLLHKNFCDKRAIFYKLAKKTYQKY